MKLNLPPIFNIDPRAMSADVWAATMLPDGTMRVVFFCLNCESFPQAGNTPVLSGDITQTQGGHINVRGGTRMKPLKSDDTFFVR